MQGEGSSIGYASHLENGHPTNSSCTRWLTAHEESSGITANVAASLVHYKYINEDTVAARGWIPHIRAIEMRRLQSKFNFLVIFHEDFLEGDIGTSLYSPYSITHLLLVPRSIHQCLYWATTSEALCLPTTTSLPITTNPLQRTLPDASYRSFPGRVDKLNRGIIISS